MPLAKLAGPLQCHGGGWARSEHGCSVAPALGGEHGPRGPFEQPGGRLEAASRLVVVARQTSREAGHGFGHTGSSWPSGAAAQVLGATPGCGHAAGVTIVGRHPGQGIQQGCGHVVERLGALFVDTPQRP